MFIGSNEQNLDAKGRISFPAKFREVVKNKYKGSLVITRFPVNPCLVIYPFEEWEEIKKKWSQLPASDGLRNQQRFINAYAEVCELDKQGRILIPLKLREYAELVKEVIIVGLDTKIEIWDRTKWNGLNLKNKSEDLTYIDKITEIGF